jgi:hypothetical protein
MQPAVHDASLGYMLQNSAFDKLRMRPCLVQGEDRAGKGPQKKGKLCLTL